MFAFIYLIGKDALRYAVIAAAVLTYVEIGPGGEALGNLVATIVQVLLGIDWEALAVTVGEQLSELVGAVVDTLSDWFGEAGEYVSDHRAPWPIKAHRGGRARQLGNTEIALAMELQTERCSIKQIARGFSVSPDHLTKTLYRARHAGMVPTPAQ